MELYFRRHDSRYNDIQNNDTQNNDTQNNDTQNNDTQNNDTQNKGSHNIQIDASHSITTLLTSLNTGMLSVMTLNVIYAECHLC